MRLFWAKAALVGVLAVPVSASAGRATASGSVGTGLFGAALQTAFDLGIDLTGDDYAVGFGARLRFLSGQGLRDRDWDDTSEIARVIRYALYQRPAAPDELTVSAAAGELGDAVLGEGAVLDGYASGVNADHGRLGAQLRVSRGRFGAEAILDDVVTPRLGGVRGTFALTDRSRVGASVAGDLFAPTMDGPTPLIAVVLEAEHQREAYDGQLRGVAYTEASALFGAGAGVHLGARSELHPFGSRLHAGARAELRLGSSGYVPGWIGPLYEVERDELLDRARAGGMWGLSGLGELSVEVEEVGRLSAGYSQRRGLPDLVTAHLAAPNYRGLQAAAWTAVTTGGDQRDFALAAELRARLPRRLFVTLEAARVYTEDTQTRMMVPIFTALAAVGGVLGEGD